MPQKNDESQLISAIQAIQKDPTLRPRVAARIYSVDHRKLGRCLHGLRPRRDIPANSRKLTDTGESVIVQYILDLAAKGFPARVSVVEDMANDFSQYATRHARDALGFQTLSIAVPSSGHASSGNTTTRGLCARSRSYSWLVWACT